MKGERSKAGGGRGSEANIYYWEVLHRVLYPNTHGNGTKKKKKFRNAAKIKLWLNVLVVTVIYPCMRNLIISIV